MIHPLSFEEVQEAIQEQYDIISEAFMLLKELESIRNDYIYKRDYYDSPVGINNQ